MHSIYIHIPFCIKKCFYCDFLSFAGKQALYANYTDALILELQKKAPLFQGECLKTIFFGGGTPTILPIPLLQNIMNAIFKYYTVSPHAEITIEANPGTLSPPVLKALYQMGFQRLSIGLQAWQDILLQKLGRVHTLSMFLENYYHAREVGFKNINIDIMFSLPEQTQAQWEQTLYEVAALQPEHISAYSLIIEEGTPFFELFQKNKLILPEEEQDRKMYYMTKEILATHGYDPYEISNFSKKDYECRHNKVYWQTKHYLGFGLGAHSYYQNKRFHNPYDIKKYIASKGKILAEDVENLTMTELQSEFMFMGLRMTEGVSATTFKKRFGVSLQSVYGKQIEILLKQNLLQQKQDHYFLTERGIDLSNTVFCYFLKD